MTVQQELFYYGSRVRKYYENVQKDRELTPREKHHLDEVNKNLWSSIVRFAMQTAHSMMYKCNLSNDAYPDIQQELASKFFEMLPKYDPLRTAPTTFFVRYFKETVQKYLGAYSRNLSQYDANNVSAVRRAIAIYESKGIAWNEEMLANKTGLSLKVLKKTLQIAQNSKRAAIEDAEFLVSNTETPEESYIKNESQEAIVVVINRVLTDEERLFWLTYVNLNGQKNLTYAELASIFHISVATAKQRKHTIQIKLNADPDLIAMAKARHIDTSSSTVNLQDNSVDIMEIDFLDALSDMENEKKFDK